MTMLKKGFLSVAAIAVMTGFVGCSSDDGGTVAPPTGGNPGGGDYVTLTIPTGWSDVTGEDGTVTYDSTAMTDSGFVVTLARPKADEANEIWPTAAATGSATEKNFEGLTSVIVKYKVESIKPDAADGLALYLCGEESDGSAKLSLADNVGGFRAVLDHGKDSLGVFVTDTLELKDFSLDWGEEAGLKKLDIDYTMDGTDPVATLDKNLAILESSSTVAFTIESDNTASADEVKIAVESIKMLGVTLK